MKKKGISLIVLVITIIVMIILAASVVISLSNTGIIDRATYAIDVTDKQQVQDLAALTWAECYMEEYRDEQLVSKVKEKLSEQGIKDDNWFIGIDNKGIKIKEWNDVNLGDLAKLTKYGMTIDYSVTVDGTEYNKWKICYKTDEYVFLILNEVLDKKTLPATITALTDEEKELYKIFKLGNTGYELNFNNPSSRAVAGLIVDYKNFANNDKYGNNIVGAIGGVTLEMLVAGRNELGCTPKLELTTNEYGYLINGKQYISGGFSSEKVYMAFPYSQASWTTSPCSSNNQGIFFACSHELFSNWHTASFGIRPVVCFKASTPAKLGITTDISIVK